MKIKVTDSPARLSQVATDVLAVAVAEGKLFTPRGSVLDRSLGGLLSRVLRKEEIKGKVGETRLVDTPSCPILLVGIGDPKKFDSEVARKIAARVVRTGDRLKACHVTIEDLPIPSKMTPEQLGKNLAEGAVLGQYAFHKYKSEKNPTRTVETLILHSSRKAGVAKGVQTGIIVAQATNLARDLINTPATDMTPRRMAEEARRIGRLPRLSVKIYDRRQIQRMGMGCYLAVASGSVEPPYFVHLVYRPAGKPRKKIALVGKGVTFDSGGLSLKTAQSMETMKDDMSGAAAMLGVMQALSVLRPPVEVHGISAITENMPSGSADKPGDIATSMNGKTVEILNTDAEGRLTLADALAYAQKQKPDLMIDVATLTGACVIALGELCSAIMGNHEKLIQTVIACGLEAGEKIWELPLIEEYKDDLKSPIADLKNIGGRWGGCINGGLFLQEFVNPKVPWAHIDIAGPSWTEKELDYSPRGGTGFGVRTLLNFLLSL